MPLSNFLPSGSTSLTCMWSSYSTTFAIAEPVREGERVSRAARRAAHKAVRTCCVSGKRSTASAARRSCTRERRWTARSSDAVTQQEERAPVHGTAGWQLCAVLENAARFLPYLPVQQSVAAPIPAPRGLAGCVAQAQPHALRFVGVQLPLLS